MGCRSCRSNPCACNVVPLPYYEEPCFQENQCQGVQIFNQFSPVLRISTEWAVPEADQLVTLRVSALSDMLIGAVIWNPDYGAYLVVTYDPEGQAIKVTKTEDNEAVVGTVIPACTKFIIGSNPFINTTGFGEFINFTPDPEASGGAGGALDNIDIHYSDYSVIGEQVSLILSFGFDVITNTIGQIDVDLPEAGFVDGDQSVPCTLILGGVSEIGKFTINAGLATAAIQKADESTMAVDTDCTVYVNLFYRKVP